MGIVVKMCHLLPFIFSRKLKRKTIICLFILALIPVSYSVFWYGSIKYIKIEIESFIDHATKDGVSASYKKLEINGFPFKFRITFSEPKLQILSNTGKQGRIKKWIWRGNRAVIDIKPWSLSNFRFDLSGLNSFSVTGADGQYEFISEAKSIDADVIMTNSRIEKLKLMAQGLHISEKLSGIETSIGRFFFDTQLFLKAENSNTKAENRTSRILELKLNDIQLPEKYGQFFSNHLDRIYMNLRVSENLKPALNIDDLKTWRDAGGIIDIDSFEGYSGKLRVFGSGTLALDKKLQPLLALTANFVGIVPLINRLTSFGFINRRTAYLTKFFLSGILQRSITDTKSISVPLTIQDSRLSIGPAKILTMPFINWEKGFVIEK